MPNMHEVVTHAVLAERLDNLKADLHDVKSSVQYMGRTMIGVGISLLIMGTGTIVAAVMAIKGG